MTDALLTEQTGGVLRMTFNRPDTLNALTADLISEAAATIEKLDSAVRVVVLTGAGRAFCSGADVTASETGHKVGTATIDAANRLIRALRATRHRGRPRSCGRGGLLHRARRRLRGGSRIRILPAGFHQHRTDARRRNDCAGTRRDRPGTGRRMAMLAERIPAPQAQQWGLIGHCVPNEAFDAEVAALTERLAEGPTAAYAATKRALNATTLAGLDAALELERKEQTALFATQDYAEGTTAFAEKRAPRFTGR